MSVNSPLQTPAINEWLANSARQLKAIGIVTARLDAEIILAHTLKKSRTYLHAHADDILPPRQVEIADARLALRLDRVPIAYIIGHKEFYGRHFDVSTATLIPRPESEVMIDLLKEILPSSMALIGDMTQHLVDIGTGSGALGITAKLEFPELDVSLTDISQHALTVAKKNAAQLHADVTIIQSDLLQAYPLKPDIILANLPYVDPEWERSIETNYEPSLALFAGDTGQALIKKLIDQTQERLTPHGYLFIEADPSQHVPLTKYAEKRSLKHVSDRDYILVFQKIN